MRRFALILLIVFIGVVLLAVVGPEVSESTFIGEAGQMVRDFFGGIAESIGFSVRGFAPAD